MESGIIALVTAAVVIAVVLFLIIHFSPQANKVDKQKYQSKWLAIEQGVKTDNIDSRQMAILNADKLLDQALRETGSRGSTMSERMKSRQGVWSNANSVWAAHKLRNKIAHETSVQVSEDMTRRALASFKVALKDLGVM